MTDPTWPTREVVLDIFEVNGFEPVADAVVTFAQTDDPWCVIGGVLVAPSVIVHRTTTGYLTADLPRTDVAIPAGRTWTATVVAGSRRKVIRFALPAGDGPLNLATVTPLLEPTALHRYVSSVNGTAPDENGNVMVAGGGDTAALEARVTELEGFVASLTGVVEGQQDLLATTARRAVVRDELITTGNIGLPDTMTVWTWLPGFELIIPAAVGDRVDLSVHGMRNTSATAFLDVAVRVGSDLVRYLTTRTSIPPHESDPGFYQDGGFPSQSGGRGFTVTAEDLDSGLVRFVVAVKAQGAGVLYADAEYPFYWRAVNSGPVG